MKELDREELDRCKNSMEYFARNYMTVTYPDGKKGPVDELHLEWCRYYDQGYRPVVLRGRKTRTVWIQITKQYNELWKDLEK